MNSTFPTTTTKHPGHTVSRLSTTSLSPHLAEDHPDEHLCVYSNETCSGHCSLWWRRTPELRDHRLGLIGHFFAQNASSADCLLRAALKRLRRERCTLAVGPMNGSTWRDYRWVTRAGRYPRFLLEPENPPAYPQYLLRHGFQPIAHYFSALTDGLRTFDALTDRVRSRLDRKGVQLRSICKSTFREDVLSILEVARAAFRQNLLYADPGEEEFLSLCRRFQQVAPFDYVLMAFERDRPVGFVLAVPDQQQRLRQPSVDTLIVKTLAVVPERRYAGLGHLLLTQVEHAAANAGFRRAIYALVREMPHLQRISNRSAQPIRRYAIYARELST